MNFFEPAAHPKRPTFVTRINALIEEAFTMSRIVRSMLTFATVGLNTASSAFALDFGQPSLACYGRVIGGDDETIYTNGDRDFSIP